HLHEGNLSRRGAANRRDRRLWQAGHGREVSDQPEQRAPLKASGPLFRRPVEGGAVPTTEISPRLVGALIEIQDRVVWRGSRPDRLVREDEVGELSAVVGSDRTDRGRSESGRLRTRVRVERRL